MIFVGAGMLWFAIIVVALCLCKFVSMPNISEDDEDDDICRWCGRLPIHSQELCEPCLDQARKIGLDA